MSDQNDPRTTQKDWPGLSEVDKALHENRLTAYTWKKTWADPWGRLGLIVFFIAFLAFAIFVAVYDGLIAI